MKPAYIDLGEPDDIFQAPYIVKFDKDGITTNKGEFYPFNKSEFTKTSAFLGAEVYELNRRDFSLYSLCNNGILGVYVDNLNCCSYIRVFHYNPNVFLDCSKHDKLNTLGLYRCGDYIIDYMLWYYQSSISDYYTIPKQKEYLKDYYQRNKAYLEKLFFVTKGIVE